mgnify:CR=1 FL=1
MAGFNPRETAAETRRPWAATTRARRRRARAPGREGRQLWRGADRGAEEGTARHHRPPHRARHSRRAVQGALAGVLQTLAQVHQIAPRVVAQVDHTCYLNDRWQVRRGSLGFK